MYRQFYKQHNSLKFTNSVKLKSAKVMFRARHIS